MTHYARGEGAMPRLYEKWQDEKRSSVRVQFGAGAYEDKFRFYWLVSAWVFMAFQGLSMLILLLHMSNTGAAYNWQPHAIGAAIIVPSFAAVACIYRFILFPSPGYYSVSGQQYDDDASRYYGNEAPPAPPAQNMPATRPAPREGVAA